jgi:ParB family transcriptional regulator, chromosome partitioning protein
MIEKGELSSGHARCLVVIEDKDTQLKFAIQAKEKKLSVREFEKLIKDYLNPKVKEKPMQSIELKDLVNEMQRTFATKVSILGNDNKGRIYIDYYNKDDLDRIAQLLNLIKSKTLTLQDLSNYNKIK